MRTFSSTFFTLLIVSLCGGQFLDVIGQFTRLFTGNRDDPINGTIDFKDHYDFIIIGAGSGGSVLANRLTENPKWEVLLLEAGIDETFLTDIPLLAALQTVTSYNWGYHSEKMTTACLGLIDQKCHIPRGKGLGGTSLINFLLYNRGHQLDYDEWEALGNPGWSYQKVLPYFIKSENCTVCEDKSVHGVGGYLSVEHPKFKTPLIKAFMKSGGFSEVLATMKNGARCSASKAFLKPVKDRPNLHISTASRVTKILIDSKTKQAYGVEFLKNRKKIKVRAIKEVLLSAGSINSPQLLMLSGVGPKDDLQRLKIPLIQDLKVGYNLQDHMAMSTLAFFVNESITVSDLQVQNPMHIYNYLVNGRGPYTIPGGALGLGFVRTKHNKRSGGYPDIEFVLGAGAINGDVYGSLRHLLAIPNSVYNKVYLPHLGRPAFSIATVLMRPKSKGRVLLKDANPLHWPILRPNYFAEEEDVNTMVEGIKMAISLTKNDYFQKYGATLNPIPFPGCEHHSFGSDPYWACSVRHVSTTLGHQVGTCKMGPPTDPDAVVDSELRVYGIRGLRVVDGSIMPNIVAGHTNAPIFMIGEKAADFIKNAWRYD